MAQSQLMIAKSAYKHGLSRSDIEHVVGWVVEARRMDDDPRKLMMVGFDSAGGLLEILSVVGDDGRMRVVHAMRRRPMCRAWLEEGER
ncbi:MAG: hypothetical protein LBO20_05965 [Bifidobacteriaceae bacterium]|nr:hypothetical protein [Bifidobacteriaceae bacterium]